MELSKNWVTANIKKELEFNQKRMTDAKESKNTKMLTYYKGVVKGLEIALKSIDKSFKD